MMLLLRRLWIQATADRKRFGLLCAMVGLALLLWARIIITSNVPRTAVAEPEEQAPLAPGDPAGSGKHKGPPVRVKLARFPVRDPLVVSSTHFPKPDQVDVLPPKSGPNAAESLQQQEARLTEHLRELVSRFTLEAVMLDEVGHGRPMAHISGTTYRQHERIPAVGDEQVQFELVEVGHRWATLEFAGRRFELRMKTPGNQER